jgi:hypothetical protein
VCERERKSNAFLKDSLREKGFKGYCVMTIYVRFKEKLNKKN